MMRIAGVIAEYDPFHLGHAYQLREARERYGADAVIVVMSCCFTQRGEAAILPPHLRARMALENGADAVIALPALWSLRDAEHFALGGVSLLQGLGVSAISFGAENDSLPLLRSLAQAMEDPSPMMLSAIHSRLDAGMSYPAALHHAIGLLLPEAAPLLLSPNNTLAVCYLRAMLRLGAQMDVIPVQRQGSYHATQTAGALSSATAVRAAVRADDWPSVQTAVPPSVLETLLQSARAGRLHAPDALDAALLYRLRTMTMEEWRELPGLSEGIEDRLRKAAVTASTREALLDAAKTKRYPRARLSRLCTHALLHFDQTLLDETPLPPVAWLLGFRRDAEGLLKELSKGSTPLISSLARLDRREPWLQAELRAWDVWALGCGLPSGLAFTEKMVVL